MVLHARSLDILNWTPTRYVSKMSRTRPRANQKETRKRYHPKEYENGRQACLWRRRTLSKLVGIFLVLLASEAAWERTSIVLQHLGSESKESRTTDDDHHSLNLSPPISSSRRVAASCAAHLNGWK